LGIIANPLWQTHHCMITHTADMITHTQWWITIALDYETDDLEIRRNTDCAVPFSPYLSRLFLVGSPSASY
jgi:hypothetical protein